jgi:hypothetical protein
MNIPFYTNVAAVLWNVESVLIFIVAKDFFFNGN